MSRSFAIRATLLALGAASAASATILSEASIGRLEEMIEMEGASVPNLVGHDVDDFALYVWDGDEFQPLNFQVDERGPGGGYFGEDAETGFVDDNDFIVFMTEDLGDQVGPGAWLDHANVDPDHRYEIEIEDPLIPGDKGWAYLFLGADLPRSSEDYVDVVSENPFHVASDRYGESYFEDLPAAQKEVYLLPPIQGTSTDLNDRMKFRLKISPLFDWQTEESGEVDELNIKDGTVRVISAYNVKVPILEFALSNTQVFYHRQMSVVRNKIFQLFYPEAKRMLWISDSNPAITDFTYYDNRGGDPQGGYEFTDLVDGDGTRDERGAFTFEEMVSPTQGGTVSVQDNSALPALEILAYYCDECGEESWPESGDGIKWGEHGTWLKNIDFVAEPFELESWNWRLAPYTDGSRGHLYAQRYFNRLTVATVWQEAQGVEDEVPGPPVATALRLDQNAPNPFNPRTSIRFHVPDDKGDVRLEVFDAAGRRVRLLAQGEMAPGEHVIIWDGKNDGGQELASGVYACRIVAGGEHQTRRMLMLK